MSTSYEHIYRSLIPSVTLTDPTDLSRVFLNFGDGTGARNEIGPKNEWEAERIAVMDIDTLREEVLRNFIVTRADRVADYPWRDREALSDWPYPFTISENMSHFPDIFFPAAMNTDSDLIRSRCVQALEDKYYSTHDFNNNLPITNYIINSQTRGIAWQLRENINLTILEYLGLTNTTGEYALALENMRAHILAQMNIPVIAAFNHLGSEIYKIMDGRDDEAGINWDFSSWQQSYMAWPIAYAVIASQIIPTIGDWMPIANFHVQHWIKKQANWDWWVFDNYYSFIGDAVSQYNALTTDAERDSFAWWDAVQFSDRLSDGGGEGGRTTRFTDALIAANWDSSLIPDRRVNDVSVDNNLRLDQQINAVATYAHIGATGAASLRDDMLSQRAARLARGGASDPELMRFSFYWRS